jgi:hypothetical protein
MFTANIKIMSAASSPLPYTVPNHPSVHDLMVDLNEVGIQVCHAHTYIPRSSRVRFGLTALPSTEGFPDQVVSAVNLNELRSE